MKFAISGYGFVGKATEIMIKERCFRLQELEIQDPKYSMVVSKWEDVDYHMICVSTFTKESDELTPPLDLTNVIAAINFSKENGFVGTTVIRSTISATDYDAIVTATGIVPTMWPEFLRQHHWEEDAHNPMLMVMAGKKANNLALEFVDTDITVIEDPRAACMMKLARNAFLAIKTIIASDLVKGCEKMDIDYQQVKTALLADPHIGPTHWDQPGHDGAWGYGGVCLPKDTKALGFDLYNTGILNNFASWATKKNANLRS